MKYVFFTFIILVMTYSKTSSQKIQYFGEEDFYSTRYPFDFIYPNNGNRKFIDLVNTDNGLVIFKINVKEHLVRDTFLVRQLNVELSTDSANSWSPIHIMPSNDEVLQYQSDLINAESKNFGLEIYDHKNLVIFGKDTTALLIYLKNNDTTWAVQELIRFNNKDIEPLEALWLNKNEC